MKRIMAVPMRSFRLRIALWSTLLSGIVVAAFCAGTWTVLKHMNASRIDEDILRTGHRQLSMPQNTKRWEHLEESIQFLKGDERDEPFILLVKGKDGAILHQSKNWPAQLPPDSFPVPIPSDFATSKSGAPEKSDPPLNERNTNDTPFSRNSFRNMEPPMEDFGGMEDPGTMGGPEPGSSGNLDGFGGPAGPGDPGRPGRPGKPPPQLQVKTVRFFTSTLANNNWRIGIMQNPEVTLILGRNLSQFNADMRFLSHLFMIAIPSVLLLIAASGWWIAQRALRPIRTLSNMAEGITARGLDQRIPLHNEDAEFNRLIQVFNRMMDRLETSFHQAVRFSADAAHELKTPLTILQGELEQALQNAVPESPEQQLYNTLFEEVQRLKTIIQKLLLLSLADSGQLRIHLIPNNLTQLVEEAIADVEILAPHLKTRQRLDKDVMVNADADLLRQVIQNLISNAIKYNCLHGKIHLRLRREKAGIRLTIANTGAGIPAEDRGKVFDRFFRADKTRNRKIDGLGLGLSLAREIARAHSGELILEDSPPGWTAFSLLLHHSNTP